MSNLIQRINNFETIKSKNRKMKKENITKLLLNAIESEAMRSFLELLNEYFYNRKHETQIRDQLSIILNQNTSITALTEYPKQGKIGNKKGGATDLSIYCREELLATIELKHQYPKDLNYQGVIDAIIIDLFKKVKQPTSHFILILQQRTLLKVPPLAKTIKYLERDSSDISFYLDKLEQGSEFPKSYISKKLTKIDVKGRYLNSSYYFIIYAL